MTWPPNLPEEGSIDETNALAAYAPWSFITLEALQSIITHMTTGEYPTQTPITLYDPFTDTDLNLGTGGVCELWWTRDGARISGDLYLQFGAGHTLGTANVIAVRRTSLPCLPAPGGSGNKTGFAKPGGFGYLVCPESSGGAANGFRIILASAVASVGGDPIIIFVLANNDLTNPLGLENLWGGTNPINLTSYGGQYQVLIDYYCEI